MAILFKKGQKLLFFMIFITSIFLIKQFYLSNGIPKLFWSSWYDYIAKYNIETMNYGFSDIPVKSRKNRSIDENYYSLNLYNKVADLNKLKLNKGDTILEVGCGRGGGLFHLAKRYPNYNFIGLDFSKNAIDRAKNTFKLYNLKFDVGNALSLPYSDNSISVVINIESSHCYPNFRKFLSEVKRVLKQNEGQFCYADFRKNAFKEIQEQFKINFVNDITPNVLKSLEAMTSIRKQQIKKCKTSGNLFDRLILSFTVKEFVGDTNSTVYKDFKSGNLVYIHVQAINKKPVKY